MVGANFYAFCNYAETFETEETVLTEDLKKYDLLTDNLKARDASASKKRDHSQLDVSNSWVCCNE